MEEITNPKHIRLSENYKKLLVESQVLFIFSKIKFLNIEEQSDRITTV